MSTATRSSRPGYPGGRVVDRRAVRAGRRVYLPTVVIGGLAAWLSWRGWDALGQAGVARSVGARRFELAGPVVLGLLSERGR